MKDSKKSKKRIFIARILELAVIIGTIILTVKSFQLAYAMRGYKALGGEGLVPVLGLMAILVIETVLEEREGK